MKRTSQIVTKPSMLSSRELAEFLSKDGQFLRPLVERSTPDRQPVDPASGVENASGRPTRTGGRGPCVFHTAGDGASAAHRLLGPIHARHTHFSGIRMRCVFSYETG